MTWVPQKIAEKVRFNKQCTYTKSANSWLQVQTTADNIKHYMRYDFKHWRVQMTMDWPNTQACIKSMGESIQLSTTVGLKVNTQPYVDTKASLSYFLNTLMSQWVAAAEW